MMSPAWRPRLCGAFCRSENASKLALERGEEKAFAQALKLLCGEGVAIKETEELLELLKFADKYQMTKMRALVVEEAVRRLSEEGIVSASRGLILKEFNAFSESGDFLHLDEDTLCSLVEDDGLVTASEERVLEGVIRWMKAGEGGDGERGEEALRRVRYPLMGREYMCKQALELGPEVSAVKDLVLEALVYLETPKNGREALEVRHMHPSALRRRERQVECGSGRLTGGSNLTEPRTSNT